jgi:hypothetical protein
VNSNESHPMQLPRRPSRSQHTTDRIAAGLDVATRADACQGKGPDARPVARHSDRSCTSRCRKALGRGERMWLLVSAFAAGGSSQSPMVAPESPVFGRTENRALNRPS